MIAITNIFGKNQTTIPKEVRKRLGLEKNMIIEWDINDKNEAILRFRKYNSEEEMDSYLSRMEKINEELGLDFDYKRAVNDFKKFKK